MLAALIDTNDTQVLSRLSRSEHSIKEIILHVGTPSVVEPLVDFLVQLEFAKVWIISDRSVASYDLFDRIERPAMALEFCVDPGVLNQQAGPNFVANCRALTDLLDGLMGSVAAPQSDPTYRFLWNAQISLSTVLLCN